jgi:heat shock protein HslJ
LVNSPNLALSGQVRWFKHLTGQGVILAPDWKDWMGGNVMKNTVIIITLFSLTLVLLAACGGGAQDEALSLELLTGLTWQLSELNGDPALPLPEAAVTANFDEEGRMSGSASCNNYTAPFEIDGNNITIGLTALTAKICPDIMMVQERAYLGALEATTTFEVNEEELAFMDDGGNVVAHYGVVNQELAGSSWDVISYNTGTQAVRSVIIDTEITANFGDDGQMTGNAGCNDYFASYEADGENISISGVGMTEKFCMEPEGIMDQESQYLAALETADVYKIEAGRMEMRTSEGSLAVQYGRAVR